nr:hypothetical protein [Micromonospora sp. DSM 115978]
ASGAHNALRELGGGLGVAVLGSDFAARGGYGTPQTFIDGTVPALWVGVIALVLGAAVALLIPRRGREEGAPAFVADDQDVPAQPARPANPQPRPASANA